MHPKLPFHPNVKALPKSSHLEDFGNVLTFVWFDDAFFVMSAQISAILADLSLLISNPCNIAYEAFFYENVIGHGIGRKHIPAKMARLAESQSLE